MNFEAVNISKGFTYEEAMTALAGLVSTPEEINVSPEVLQLKAKQLGSGSAIDFLTSASVEDIEAFRKATQEFVH